MGRDLSPNVQQAFTNLYADTDGLGAEFARMWGVLASEFAGDTAVAGYDLLNEPGPGQRSRRHVLGPARAALPAGDHVDPRAESRTAGGFQHLGLFEPSILWSGLGFDVSPPVGFSDDPGLVFSPHLYNESITMDQGLGDAQHDRARYTLARRAADAYGVPLWSGEWGWFGDITKGDRPLLPVPDLQNENAARLGGLGVEKGMRRPADGAGDATSGGLQPPLLSVRHRAGRPGVPDPGPGPGLPPAGPGRLTSLSSSPTTVDMRLSGNGTGTLDVWIPGPGAPAVTGQGLAGQQLRRQGEGWRLSAATSGAYFVDPWLIVTRDTSQVDSPFKSDVPDILGRMSDLPLALRSEA
jgi:hypothetical protein